MELNIINRAIQITGIKLNKISDELFEFEIYISLLNFKIIVFSKTIKILSNVNENINRVIIKSVIKFKESKEYIDYFISKSQEIQDEPTITKLSLEYNTINDLSNLTYLKNFEPELTDEDIKTGYKIRYFAKFLNNNVFIETSYEDYLLIVNNTYGTHFETYIPIIYTWNVSGVKEDVYSKNSKILSDTENIYPGYMNYFNNPFYLTIFDEIENLFSLGGELSYKATLNEFSGYYHHSYKKLLSGINNETGINAELIEGVLKRTEISSEESKNIEDLMAGVENTIKDLSNDLTNIISSFKPDENNESPILKKLKEDSDILISQAKISIINSSLDAIGKDTEFGNLLQDSIDGVTKLMDNLESGDDTTQEELLDEISNQFKTARLNDIDKSDKSKDIKDDLKSKLKKSKIPKLKIPIIRGKHTEGTDHAYELGF